MYSILSFPSFLRHPLYYYIPSSLPSLLSTILPTSKHFIVHTLSLNAWMNLLVLQLGPPWIVHDLTCRLHSITSVCFNFFLQRLRSLNIFYHTNPRDNYINQSVLVDKRLNNRICLVTVKQKRNQWDVDSSIGNLIWYKKKLVTSSNSMRIDTMPKWICYEMCANSIPPEGECWNVVLLLLLNASRLW